MSKGANKDQRTHRPTRIPGESDDAGLARIILDPTTGAAGTVMRWVKLAGGGLDVTALAAELTKQCAAVSLGDLSRPEATLTAHAHALNAIFVTLASSSTSTGWNLGERYLRLALKAQSQCRATLETLALIKNSQLTVIAKQANVTSGPQQVNNGVPPLARARQSEIEPNKLLEQTRGEWLDTGTTGTAGGADSQLETVGTVNRAKDN